MEGAKHIEDPDSLNDEAAAWVVRVQSDTATEADWLALETWLSGSAERRAVFAEAEALWHEFGDRAAELSAMSARHSPAGVVSLSARRAGARMEGRPRRWLPSAAIAATLAAALSGAWLLQPFEPTPQVYSTRVGERREVALADGSQVTMNSGSRLVARVNARHRAVTLESGEAAFEVAKDHAHPFVVSVGDEAVTVVGTHFDILRDRGSIVVTVSRGIVAVQANKARVVQLFASDQLIHVEGASGSRLTRVPAEDVMAWKDGYAVYTDRQLGDIATDLSRYFTVPIRADEAVAALRFSGALRVDSEDTVLRSLQSFLPVKAVHTSNAIVLQAR